MALAPPVVDQLERFPAGAVLDYLIDVVTGTGKEPGDESPRQDTRYQSEPPVDKVPDKKAAVVANIFVPIHPDCYI